MITGAIKAAIDLIAAAIETLGCDVAACIRGSIRTRIETLVDAVALVVKPLVDPITAPVGTILDSITRVLSHRAAANAH